MQVDEAPVNDCIQLEDDYSKGRLTGILSRATFNLMQQLIIALYNMTHLPVDESYLYASCLKLTMNGSISIV